MKVHRSRQEQIGATSMTRPHHLIILIVPGEKLQRR